MLNSPSANPTPITPPRVPMLDPRTGLIDRAWYMFFLSLFTTASNAQDPALGPDTSSLLASFDAELRALSDEVGTQYDVQSGLACLAAALAALDQQFASQPSAEVGELQQQIDALRQEVQTYPQPALGTMAQLQQANVPWLTFDTTAQSVPTDIGTVAWDGGTTLGVQATADVLMRVGEAEYVYVKASSAITKGQLCYHTGAVGASGVITAAPTPLSLADPTQILGVAAESIALNGFGLIQISGDLRGFNTTGSSVGETWADGDPLYYNPSYVGSFTKTKPSAPNQKTYVGEVINAGAGSSGAINVRVIPGSVLGGTDSNVQFSALANGDLIQYDSALQYWKNVPASTLPVGTATNLAGGAAGSVPYQSAPSTTTFLGIGVAGRWLGSSGTAPQWNAPAALTKTDDTNVTLTLGGSASTALLNAASLTLGWTGQLAVSRGGTGVSTTPTNGQLLIGNGTGYTVANLTAGSGVSISNSAGGISISATGTGGTVTSVGLSMPTQFTVTNSPVTSSGTLTAAWNNQTANYVLAGPTTGAAAAPTFRALVAGDIPALSYVSSVSATAPITSTGGLTPTIGVTSAALTKTDDTNVTLTLGGSPTTALLAATSLTLGWTGTLSIARGGTAKSSWIANGVVYASGTTTLTNGTSLTFDGTTLTATSFSGPLNGTVGATTPNTGAFTTLSASSTVTFNQANASTSLAPTGTGTVTINPATAGAINNMSIGGTTAAAGAFTTLSASSTVSGTGFTNYFASPPPIGSTAANTGSFTTLTTSSTVTINGGTANGVAYLNGSKVLTTGSALTFDGTSFACTTGAITARGDSSGVGFYLGTSATAIRFNVNSNNYIDYSFGGSTGGLYFRRGAGVATSMFLDNAGNVTVPAMYGNTVTTPRNVYVDSAGMMGGISSTRASKTNIVNLDDVSWLYNLNPVTFNYRKRGKDNSYLNEFEDETQYGLIAEDVELVAPDLCIYDAESKVAGIHYDRMITPLLKALQNQAALIDELRARVKILEGG